MTIIQLRSAVTGMMTITVLLRVKTVLLKEKVFKVTVMMTTMRKAREKTLWSLPEGAQL
jgi:hypothetical protein